MIFKNKILRSGIFSLLAMLFLSVTAFGQATTANPGLEGPCTYLSDQVTVSGIDFNAVAPYVQTYAISDAAGNIILFDAAGNFGAIPPGTYDLWAFNYDPTAAVPSDPTGAATVADIMTLLATPDVCIDPAGPFPVTVCDAALFTDDSFCSTNTNIALIEAVPGTYNVNYTQMYYLVDGTGAIIATSTNAQFPTPAVGSYTVYAVNFDPADPATAAAAAALTTMAEIDAFAADANLCADALSTTAEVIVCCDLDAMVATNILCADNGTAGDPTDDTYTFDIMVTGSGTSFDDDQGNTAQTYGSTINYGPFPIAGGDITVIFNETGDLACADTIVTVAPLTCSGSTCAITPATASNIVCDNNGTPGDMTDDTYTFDILVNGGSTFPGATNTFSDDQGNANIAYGTTLNYGPFPIAGGNTIVNFTDTETAACTGMMMATAPAPCSNTVCNITVVISNYACDNGGTDNDPSDDMISFDYTVLDVAGIGTTWSSDQGDAGVAYGTIVSVGPVPADGTTWVINATEDGDPACIDDATVILNDCAVPEIPTLSEWGLITLALLLMTLGAVKMAVGSVALAGTGSKNLPMPGGNSFRLPFDMAIFRKALNITAILAIIGFAICFAIFGAIFTPDMIGVAIAGPIFAYLAHLLYILETKNK